MFPPILPDADPQSLEAQSQPHIAPTGFREYDARWRYPQDINLQGVQLIGLGLAHLLAEQNGKPALVVGHDYRSYSPAIKMALVAGLLAGGAKVYDIGLALSPTAYFAQFALDVAGVAMVTASHNANGWTGIKMGAQAPLTFSPEEMQRLKQLVLETPLTPQAGGEYVFVPDMREQYLADLAQTKLPKEFRCKAVLACGNGTAGAFAPQALAQLGVEVVPLHCELDYTFPHHNPNPEDMKMLHSLSAKVKEVGADIGFAFDGDGDRCGVVDNNGKEIFADKLGVVLARWLARKHKSARFVADVKSTSLFATDPVLAEHKAETFYWKTGHSYMKQYTNEKKALAGFEKSGHFFLNTPLGRGYDDGLRTAILICEMLADTKQSLAELAQALPPSWCSPTCSPACADEEKYQVIERITKDLQNQKQFCGQDITDVLTINGVRLQLADGSWVLIRASSNTPNLVVVTESPHSAKHMKELFNSVAELLKAHKEVGAFDQTP